MSPLFCIRRFGSFLGLFLALATTSLRAEELPSTEASEPPKRAINYQDALVLGIVEGATEYLPVSSTGHLVLTNRALGLDTNTPLLTESGEILEDDEGEPYTLKAAADAYAIIIQIGAILAVVVIYWKRILSILMGFLGRDPSGFRLGLNLLVAFMPAVVLGLLFDDLIEAKLFSAGPIAFALAAGAVLMLVVEWRRPRTSLQDLGPDLHQLSFRQCLTIGFLQCVAMWPGTSRSMMTIVGGYLVGLRPARAAEFSFLLGLITLSAAAGYRILTDGPTMLAALDPGPVAFGILVAFVAAAISVRWLVSFLTRRGLTVFAIYRLVLAGLVWWFWTAA